MAEPDRERILETRLVLSQDFGPVNVAFNWINETDVSSGFTAFGYAAGVMWVGGHHAGHAMAGEKDGDGGGSPEGHAAGTGVGLETYGGLGDTKAFGFSPALQEHYLGPIIMHHFTSRLMMHEQLAIGLRKASDNLVRVSFGYDF